MRAIDVIAGQPWLITPEGLRQIASIAERTNDKSELEALAARRGESHRDAWRIDVREGGIGVLSVTGPLMRYANIFSEISGATSTQMLARNVQTALDDDDIKALVLEINSPGGQVEGIHELANMVYAARKRKPIYAYGDGTIASAAYWIASAAERIIVDRTSVLGSIGVVMTLTDTKGRDAKQGIRQLEIVSSQSPDKRIDPDLDEGRAKLQTIVDDLAAVFVDSVATFRGTTPENVIENYGRGGLLVGEAAVRAGLADEVGSLEAVIDELRAQTSVQHRFRSYAMSGKAKGPITVLNTAEMRAALAAGHQPDEITIDVDSQIKTAVEKAVIELEAKHKATLEAATTAASASALKAERERINGLRAIAQPGFEKEIDKAIESGAAVGDTAIAIGKAAKDRGVTVAQLRSDSPEALGHGGSGAQTQVKGWTKITSRMKKKAS